MKKGFLLWLMVIISLLTLTSCKYHEEEKVEKQPQQELTASVDASNKSDNSNEAKKTVISTYILQKSDIAQFPEVPEWKPEEIVEQMGQGQMVPQFLIDIYEKSGLDGKSMQICLPNGKYIVSLCIDNDGQYYFSGIAINGDEPALYKNKNGCITVVQKMKQSRRLREFIYENNGSIMNWEVTHMDYMDDSGAKLIDYADDFTIIYYPETSEAVCIRYGTEIGPRTKIDSNLLSLSSWTYESKDGAMCYNNSLVGYPHGSRRWLKIGFINEGRLIYPIILKNGEEVSFHLYVVTVLGENIDEVYNIAVREAGQTEIDEIEYGVYQGKAYVIQNATEREARDGLPTGFRLIVEDTEIHLQVQEVEISLGMQKTETPPDVQETEILPEIQEGETMPEM